MTFPVCSVAELVISQPRRHKLKTNEYSVSGAIPIVDQGASFLAGFTDDLDRAYEGPLPVIIFGDHTCCLKYVDFRFAIGADGTQVLRPTDGLDARYLYYALHTTNLQQFGYQRHFKLLKDSQVPVPPLPTQRRIAAILGDYDDLIEVNRRRVAVLEEIARGLFHEWFVRFRFPGHEGVPTLESDVGRMPVSWRKGILGDLVEFRRDSTQPGEHLEGRAYVPIECIGRRTLVLDELRPWHEAQSSLQLFEKGDILFGAMRAYFHKVVSAPLPGVTRSTCFVLRPREPHLSGYALMQLFRDSTVAYAAAHSKGATIPYAQWGGVLERMNCLIPDRKTALLFEAAVRPQIDLLEVIWASNQRLSAARDLLLPRLISGQLSVEAAERELEDAA